MVLHRLAPALAALLMTAGGVCAQILVQPAPPPPLRNPDSRSTLQPVPSKEEQAAKAAAAAASAAAAAGGKCARFEAGRNAVYAAAIRTVLPELPQPGQAADVAAFQGDVEKIHAKYEAEARAGDVGALRKLMAVEMFAMQLQRKDAPEPTLAKACALAGAAEKQRVILDPLACAVLSLEGSRKDDPIRRDKAKAMMAAAKAMVPANANASNAAKLLHDEVEKGLDGCY